MEIVSHDRKGETIVNAIRKSAHIGECGQDNIFELSLFDALPNITVESGEAALAPSVD